MCPTNVALLSSQLTSLSSYSQSRTACASPSTPTSTSSSLAYDSQPDPPDPPVAPLRECSASSRVTPAKPTDPPRSPSHHRMWCLCLHTFAPLSRPRRLRRRARPAHPLTRICAGRRASTQQMRRWWGSGNRGGECAGKRRECERMAWAEMRRQDADEDNEGAEALRVRAPSSLSFLLYTSTPTHMHLI